MVVFCHEKFVTWVFDYFISDGYRAGKAGGIRFALLQ